MPEQLQAGLMSLEALFGRSLHDVQVLLAAEMRPKESLAGDDMVQVKDR